MQKWKTDKSLYDCKRDETNTKQLDYKLYVKEFMSADPVQDWDSIKGCIGLWDFFKSQADTTNVKKVLDAGTKDGQFTEYLNQKGFDCTGIEIDDQYVEYAQEKGRDVVKGNICDLEFKRSTFDCVFSHHVFGLCPSYLKAYQECLRVTKKGGYVITLNDSKGNPRKHYQLISGDEEVKTILTKCQIHDIVYFGHPNKDTELVVILRKK